MPRQPYITFADACRNAAILKTPAYNDGNYSVTYTIVVMFIADMFGCSVEQVEREIEFWESD